MIERSLQRDSMLSHSSWNQEGVNQEGGKGGNYGGGTVDDKGVDSGGDGEKGRRVSVAALEEEDSDIEDDDEFDYDQVAIIHSSSTD